MANIKKEEIKNAQVVFTDIWNYYKQYYQPEFNDQYWDSLVVDGRIIIDKHKNQMVTDMIMAIQEELNRRSNGI
jgi:ornithine carbamoyltransferase